MVTRAVKRVRCDTTNASDDFPDLEAELGSSVLYMRDGGCQQNAKSLVSRRLPARIAWKTKPMRFKPSFPTCAGLEP